MTGPEDDVPAPEEDNRYKLHLNEALKTVENVVETWGEDGNPAQSIINHLSTGWQCSDGDELCTLTRTKGGQIKPAFEDAESAVRTAHNNQPDKVPAGHHHGNAYVY